MVKKTTVILVLACFILLGGSGVSRSEERKDHRKGFLMSLIIPGLGQYYAGSSGYAKIFIAAELAFWGGYFYNNTIMEACRQDYYSQAALHAGVNPGKFGTSYLNAIGAYDSSYEYNMRQLQSSFQPRLYTGEKEWEWDTEKSRLKYRNLRERELEYENNAKFFVAGIVLNHFLSALNASKIIQKRSGTLSSFTVDVLEGGLMATYIRSF